MSKQHSIWANLSGLAAVAAVLATGCGGGDAARFVGTYHYAPGAMGTLTCGPMTIQLPIGEAVETIALGTHAADLVKTDSNGCVVEFDVAGNVATAAPGQTCTTNSPMGRSTVSVTRYTLTRNTDGTITTSFAGSVMQDGAPGPCQLVGTGSLTLSASP